jgi:hypothetical protein
MVYGKPFYSSDPPLEWSNTRIGSTQRDCPALAAHWRGSSSCAWLEEGRVCAGLRVCWRFSRAAPSRALVQGRASPAAASATPPCRSMERTAGFRKPTSRVTTMVVSSVLFLCLFLMYTSISYGVIAVLVPFLNCE